MVTYANRGYLRMKRVSRKWRKKNKHGNLKCWQKLALPWHMILQGESLETLIYLVCSTLGILGYWLA